jgi:DNA polymerase (family 10)
MNPIDMDNRAIAHQLELYAQLLELHGVEQKARVYHAAAFRIEKQEEPLADLPVAELIKLPGIGKSIAEKIKEITASGSFKELDELLERTPKGLLDLFRIKGLGVKKIKRLWEELGIDSLQSLEQACFEGKLARLPGMGEKTQQAILEGIAFLKQTQGKLLWLQAAAVALDIQKEIKERLKTEAIPVGALARKEPVISSIELMVLVESPAVLHACLRNIERLEEIPENSGLFCWRGIDRHYHIPVEVHAVMPEQSAFMHLMLTATEAHLVHHVHGQTLLQSALSMPSAPSEQAIYAHLGLPYIIPEMREGKHEWEWAQKYTLDRLVERQDLRGVVHAHTTYSDGKNTLMEMAEHARRLGYEYLGITDHSQSAFYANGLSEEQVRQQWQEIERINRQLTDFRLLKGIEVDILADGSLDFSDDFLAQFDFVIASIHSGLSMNRQKATQRLLKAIANPHVHILGHLTGRILLARDGYPLDMEAIVRACAEHKVAIEVNATPSRSDLDWEWIFYAMEQGVKLLITPDAHSCEELEYMEWGLQLARKGGMLKEVCLNCLNCHDFLDFFAQKA